MASALLLPVLILVLFIAVPLGWVQSAPFTDLQMLVRHPLIRLGLFVFISLCWFHWAHRFRYTLYDGLQLSHLNDLIAVIIYGIATLSTFVVAYLLWGVG
jgi:fumarate reductase subunit D